MANSLNEVRLIGNLGRDPVVKVTPAGKIIVVLSIGTTFSWREGDDWKEETEWHRCVFFGPKAESISKRFRKGDKIFVSGRIKTKTWIDSQTQLEKSTKEIICSDYVPMGNSNKDNPPQPQQQLSSSQQQQLPVQEQNHSSPSNPAHYDPYDEQSAGQDDDVPF